MGRDALRKKKAQQEAKAKAREQAERKTREAARQRQAQIEEAKEQAEEAKLENSDDEVVNMLEKVQKLAVQRKIEDLNAKITKMEENLALSENKVLAEKKLEILQLMKDQLSEPEKPEKPESVETTP